MNQLSAVQVFAVWVLPVLFAITVHEVAHGWVASKLGDNTAKALGRLTLNPVKHIDPIGTILIPGILLFLGGFIFGWARPVPINWHNLRNPKRDMALVAIGGPASNFIMAFAWAIIAKFGGLLMTYGFAWALAISYMGQAGIMINLMLMYLNLLPIPPLDGWRVVAGILPNSLAARIERFEPLGFILLLLLLTLGVLSFILVPPITATQHWIVNLFSLPA
jgi:Zn-dependent protease